MASFRENDLTASMEVENEAQTIYTSLTPLTIQDGNELRQIYVPVQQTETVASVDKSISESAESQRFPISSIPGQLITITLPPGAANTAGHFHVADDGTLLSVQDGMIELPVEDSALTNQNLSEQTGEFKLVASPAEKHVEGTFEHKTEVAGLSEFTETPVAVSKDKGSQSIRSLFLQSDEGTSLLAQSADAVVRDSTSLTESSCKIFPEVFSGVEAKLSEALLNAIPGCKQTFLKTVEDDYRVQLRSTAEDSFSFMCSTSQLVSLHEKLSVLLPQSKNPFLRKNLRHKGVNCDLLRPMFSRSGREVKSKQFELPVEDEPADIGHEPEKTLSRAKKKRSRPPKHVKVSGIQTSTDQNTTQNERKHAMKMKLPMVGVSEPNEKGTTSKEENAPHANKMEKSLMEEKEESGGDISSNFNLDHVTKRNLQVEDLIQRTTLSDMSDLNESMTMLIKLDAEKTDAKNTMSETEMLTLKPVAKSVTILSERKRPKKDYESLLPFKYFCNQCSFKSKRQSHYRRHTELHGKGLPLLQCNQCNFTTIRLSHLRRHTLFHTSNLHHCQICKYKTYDWHHLSRHIKVKHPSIRNTVVQVYECPMCQYATSTEFQYKRHLKVHADVSGGKENPNRIVSSYQCPVCEYSTKKKDHFARHLKQVHTEHRPYLCDLCGKSFKRQDTLRSHKVIHQDKSIRLYPFRCGLCNKTFRTQAHLNEHLSSHSNARQYLCEICGASFKTRNVQRKHVRTIHRNPRSHRCPDCEKSFNTKFALQRHARTHDTPGMRKSKEDMPNATDFVADGVDMQPIDAVGDGPVQNIGAEEQHHQMTTITSDQVEHSQMTGATLVEAAQHIAIPLSVEMHGQELPATIQLGEAAQTVTLQEGTYEQDADGSIRQVIPHFIQAGDATTTLLYVPTL